MENQIWIVYALLGALFAAIVAVLSKRVLDRTDLMIALSVQVVVMLLTVLALTTILGRWRELSRTSSGSLLLLALAGIAAGLSWFFGYHALQLSRVAAATPLDKLSMPMAVVLAIVFLREQPSLVNWFGIALMVAGAFCVARTNHG